jgi:hypothetical protein
VGGARDVELLLPGPTRPVDVRIDGGAANVRIVRPRKVPARLQVAHGSSKLEFDDEAFGAVGGRLRLISDGFEEAIGGRYDVVVGGGASRLSVASQLGRGWRDDRDHGSQHEGLAREEREAFWRRAMSKTFVPLIVGEVTTDRFGGSSVPTG